MSHVIQSQMNAIKIFCEESINNALIRLNNYSFRDEVKRMIIRDFGLDTIQEELSQAQNYDAVIDIAERINSFFSAVDTYAAYNFNLEITDYNAAISQIGETYAVSDDSVVKKALAEVDDELFRTYIRVASREKRYSDKGTLLAAAEEKMKESRLYKSQAMENAKRVFAERDVQIVPDANKDVAEMIREANMQHTKETIDRAVRNRVLTAIIKIVKDQGFVVKKENVEECGDHAKISAIKPNGERADFVVYLDGRFVYKFHEYEGLSCEKDLNVFEDRLESIYGIKTEEKKVIWSNPDRRGKMAHQAISNKRIGG